MLTGEWGCGKTYLLNTKLIERLNDTHVFLRISLFGVMSLDEVKTEVRKKWLYAYIESKDNNGKVVGGFKKIAGRIKELVKYGKVFLPDTEKNIIDGMLSINILEFVKIVPKIEEKKVILIFDDLERACISTTDLLGCINDYCENLGFATIIVTNEDKIKDGNENNIKYSDIKEKIIQRTVQHSPHYNSVVNSVINDLKFKSDSYRSFLRKYTDEIIVIFSGKTIDGKSLDEFVDKCTEGGFEKIKDDNKRIHELLTKRPHNIRSLKCALQDFERVYELLKIYEMPALNKWLFSFMAYMLSAKAGLINKDEIYVLPFSSANTGLYKNDTMYIFSSFSDSDWLVKRDVLVKKDEIYESPFFEDNVAKLYPGYYSDEYMLGGIKTWILDGEWDNEVINYQMSFMKEKYAAISPLEKVRTKNVFELEENEMLEGYPEFLNLAYDGKIELDEYVNLLFNNHCARTSNINFPQIDWNKIQLGVEKKIDELLQSHKESSHYKVIIDEGSKKDYEDSQWKVYETIEKYCNGELQLFENNRNLFIELMNKDPHKAYEEIRNKRLDCFSDKMAEATLDAFMTSLNADKNDMILNTKDIIRTMKHSSEFKSEQTKTALNALKCGLKSYLEQHCSSNKNSIAAAHANHFIQTIDILLAELKK